MNRSTRRRPLARVEILGSRDPTILAAQWLPDTRFGAWLLSTHAWRRHVIQVALADLLRLLGARSRAYPTILDVGCGTGRALPLLDRLFRPRLLVGVDPDSAAIQHASHEAERCRCRVQLRLGVATSLGLDDTSVDMIFCHQTFHHVADPEGAARELYRVLRPGGVLLFAESCAPFIRSLRVRLLFRHPLHAQRTADEYLSRLTLNGLLGNSETCKALNPPAVRRQRESAPPATTASHTSSARSDRADSSARAPEEQAVERV